MKKNKWPKHYTKTGVHFRHAINRILASYAIEENFYVESIKSRNGYGYAEFRVFFDNAISDNAVEDILAYFKKHKSEFGRTVSYDSFTRYPNTESYYDCEVCW